jgi:hypothetical protein
MVCVRYRPRQPRASPVWQILHDHAAKSPGLSSEIAAAITVFLECGDLHAGFTRLHCPDCGHEFLLAFSCKQRGLCASCHQRRTLTEGAFIADAIFAPVPHRHVVLTIPRLIRHLFKFDRARLDELHHAAHSAITVWLRQRTAGAATGRIHASPARPRRRRTAWRELIQQVWGVDPLKCPLCSGLLRPIAVVESKAEILAVLVPRGLDRPHERPFALGPPRPEVAVLIDAATGDCHALDPPDFPPGLPYPQPRAEPIRFRAEVIEPGEDFDQTGFELPLPPQVALAEAGQGELFGDDYAQPDSADGEPVFWYDESGQASRDDDVVQADPAELL